MSKMLKSWIIRIYNAFKNLVYTSAFIYTVMRFWFTVSILTVGYVDVITFKENYHKRHKNNISGRQVGLDVSLNVV